MNWVKEVFDYRDDGNLIWKISPSSKVSVGDLAGSPSDKRGYMRVGYRYKQWYLHRLIYAWHTGEWPPLVDHKDQNRGNNRIGNLRPLSRSYNTLNSAKSWGSTPYRGVHFCSRRQKYRAEFRGEKLGSFNSPEEAFVVYIKAKENYFE